MKEDKISKALGKAVISRNMVKYCEDCKGLLTYKGLGQYICNNCKKEMLTNYGKVRKVLDLNMVINAKDLCNITGLTREEIQSMIDDGSITLVGGNLRISE